jgi:hypothetical protein
MGNRKSRKVDFHFRIIIKFKPRLDEEVMLIFLEMHLDMCVLRFEVGRIWNGWNRLRIVTPLSDLVVSCMRSSGSARCNKEPASTNRVVVALFGMCLVQISAGPPDNSLRGFVAFHTPFRQSTAVAIPVTGHGGP